MQTVAGSRSVFGRTWPVRGPALLATAWLVGAFVLIGLAFAHVVPVPIGLAAAYFCVALGSACAGAAQFAAILNDDLPQLLAGFRGGNDRKAQMRRAGTSVLFAAMWGVIALVQLLAVR